MSLVQNLANAIHALIKKEAKEAVDELNQPTEEKKPSPPTPKPVDRSVYTFDGVQFVKREAYLDALDNYFRLSEECASISLQVRRLSPKS